MPQFVDALFERIFLVAQRGAKLIFRRERNFCFRQSCVCGIAVLTQFLQTGGQSIHLVLEIALGCFQFHNLLGQFLALLQTFLFLRGQTLNFVNHRLDFLMQNAQRILQGVELALMRRNRHFLGAQFRLRFLQSRLQCCLFAEQRALHTTDFVDLFLHLRA